MNEKTNNSRIYYLITGLVLILFSISFFSLRFESVFSRMHESKMKLLKSEIEKEYHQADFNRLKFEQGYCRMSSEMGKWESDERVPARLSDKTNRLYLCRWVDGGIVPLYDENEFAWDLSSLTLRKNSLVTIQYDDTIQKVIDVLQEQKRFKYDTLFLAFSGEDMKLKGKNSNGREVIVRYNENSGLVVE